MGYGRYILEQRAKQKEMGITANPGSMKSTANQSQVKFTVKKSNERMNATGSNFENIKATAKSLLLPQNITEKKIVKVDSNFLFNYNR